MKWIIIGILAAVVALCAWRGFKGGIIRGICGVLTLIIALYLAGVATKMYYSEFTGMIDPFINGMVGTHANNIMTDDDSVKVPVADEDKDDVYSITYSIARQMGFAQSAAEQLAKEASETTSTVNNATVMNIADRIAAKFAYVLVYGLSFAIIAIIFAVIGNVIGLSFHIPALGVAEPIVGTLLGIARGILLMYAIAIFLRYLGLIIPDEFFVENELIFKIVNNNPVAIRLGM